MRDAATWDIFCTVIDNYGDAGVSWRLARALARDHGVHVRLWVDDLNALATLAPTPRPGVEVRAWTQPFPDVEPGDVVIEAFGSVLPENYLRVMARRTPPPVWINLEYLSAEPWVDEYHLGRSPHPRLPLVKHFFFPGFTARTGGLLRERRLEQARRAFLADAAGVNGFWRSVGLDLPAADEMRVSLFCYDTPLLPGLLAAWAEGDEPITALMPIGAAADAAARYFGRDRAASGNRFERGALTLQVIPFSDQDGYDRLLWACDLNFVRGEDSFVRAQWAAKPLVWHIYVQEAGAHLVKLDAFLARYCAGMPAAAADAVAGFMRAWNRPDAGPGAGAGALAQAWSSLRREQPEAARHARRWAAALARGPELAEELVKFAQAHVK